MGKLRKHFEKSIYGTRVSFPLASLSRQLKGRFLRMMETPKRTSGAFIKTDIAQVLLLKILFPKLTSHIRRPTELYVVVGSVPETTGIKMSRGYLWYLKNTDLT